MLGRQGGHRRKRVGPMMGASWKAKVGVDVSKDCWAARWLVSRRFLHRDTFMVIMSVFAPNMTSYGPTRSPVVTDYAISYCRILLSDVLFVRLRSWSLILIFVKTTGIPTRQGVMSWWWLFSGSLVYGFVRESLLHSPSWL